MLIIRDFRMWTRRCFHLNAMFTTGLRRIRRIKSLHLNFSKINKLWQIIWNKDNTIIEVIPESKESLNRSYK